MRKHMKVLLGITAATGLTVALAASLPSVSRTDGDASSSWIGVALAAQHGDHQAFRGRGIRHVCSGARAEKIEDVIGFVDAFFEFTPAQGTAWQDLVAAVRRGNNLVDTHCETLLDAGKPATAPERLARMHTMLAAGIELIETVQPPFSRFYSSLVAKQQEAIDRLVTWRGSWSQGGSHSR